MEFCLLNAEQNANEDQLYEKSQMICKAVGK